MLVNGEKVTTLNVKRSFLKENKRYKTFNVEKSAKPYGKAQDLVDRFKKNGLQRCRGLL